MKTTNESTFKTNQYMRFFVRHCIKGGRCGSFNQYYKSIIPDEVFNFNSKELDTNGN